MTTEPRPIALIGPPGSGKTTIAGELASALSWQAVDGDEYVTEHGGASPEDLAISLPTDRAHAIIVDALTELAKTSPARRVVAMPSSIIDIAEAADVLAAYTTVFLDVDLATSFPRTGLGAPRPVGFVLPRGLWHEMLTERRPRYDALADHTIDVSGATIQTIVEQIEAKIASNR